MTGPFYGPFLAKYRNSRFSQSAEIPFRKNFDNDDDEKEEEEEDEEEEEEGSGRKRSSYMTRSMRSFTPTQRRTTRSYKMAPLGVALP